MTEIAEGVRTLRGLTQTIAVEAKPTLDPLGLNLPTLLELVQGAAGEDSRPAQSRCMGRLFHLYGFDVKSICAMTGLDADVVGGAIDKSPRVSAARQVLALHGQGLTVGQIHDQTGLERGSIYRWLEDAGVQPNRTSKIYTPNDRQRAAELYEQGRTYSEIADVLGLDRARAAGLVRTAARRGECPSYGTRRP